VKSGEATFIEKRQVEMLDRTLESSGRLSFRAPDTFIRETAEAAAREDSRSRATADHEPGRAQPHVAARQRAGSRGHRRGVRGTLTGNRETLERLFETTVSGSAGRWSLELVPRDLRLRGQVASVRVTVAAAIGARGPGAARRRRPLDDDDRAAAAARP
jgi:hypothetical protein